MRNLESGTQNELADLANKQILRHKQHYRALKILAPEIEFEPYYIGTLANPKFEGIDNEFLFGAQEALAKADISKSKPRLESSKFLYLSRNENKNILFVILLKVNSPFY